MTRSQRRHDRSRNDRAYSLWGLKTPIAESAMTKFKSSAPTRRTEAERLIDLAKAMLSDATEQMAVIYLDHALDALHAIPAETVDPNA